MYCSVLLCCIVLFTLEVILRLSQEAVLDMKTSPAWSCIHSKMMMSWFLHVTAKKTDIHLNKMQTKSSLLAFNNLRYQGIICV